jgi:CubicO group peptidase (beta-lactamase class C family)
MNEAKFQVICQQTRELMQKLHIPGLSLGVVMGDEELTESFGVTSLENPLAVDETTLFQIGSITKTFTATAAMRLVQMGKLELERPVKDYIPELRMADSKVSEVITLRHLFTHTGGWTGDFFIDTGPGNDALLKYAEALVETPQLTPPGALWSYNNAGFSLAGRVIEVVTDKPYEAAIQELLFAPLKLQDTFFFAEDAISRRVAIGHITGKEGHKVARPWALTRCSNAAGGICMSIKDLLRYARFQMSEGEGLLTPENMAFMKSNLAEAGNYADSVGVSWFIKKIGNVTTIGHNGATNGFNASLLLVPERNFAIAFLTNSGRGAELYREVIRIALLEFLGESEDELDKLALTLEQLAEFTGRFRATLTEWELVLKEGELLMQARSLGGFPTRDTPPPEFLPPPVRLSFFAPDRVVALEAPFTDLRGEFLRDVNGKIEWFRFSGRISKKQ